MSDNKCPLCGSPLEDGHSVCHNCDEEAKNRSAINFSFQEEQPAEEEKIDKQDTSLEENTLEQEESEVEENIRRKHKTSNKKVILYFSFAAILFITAGVFLFVQHKNKQHAENTELSFWFSCIEKNTPSAYSEYLYLYPTGKFHEDAQLKIAELRKKEYSDWEKLKNSTDLFEYSSFLNNYPETPFKNDIKHRMDSLSWLVAQREDSPESYSNYIENARLGSITGYYTGIAQERYDYLKSIRVIEGMELDSLKNAVTEYFGILSKSDFKKLSEKFTPLISNFYGEKNHSSQSIIKTIQNDMKKNGVNDITYVPDLKNISVIQDTTGLYSTEIKVTKKIAYKSKKKKNETSNELLNMELTSDFKVRSMYIRDIK